MAPLSLAVFAAALAAAPPPLPETLAQTGLYVDAAMRHVASEARPYSPQYPLWSDGARKQRWLRLPAGTAIDASDPSAWEFPPGTKLWKQFSHGRALETRYIERLADGSWRFATYLWECRRNRRASGARVRRHACRRRRARRPLRRAFARRLSRLPRHRRHAGVGRERAAAFVRSRSARTACGSVVRARSRRRHDAARRSAGELAGRQAAHRCAFAAGTRGARLLPRQLRSLPRRRRCQCRGGARRSRAGLAPRRTACCARQPAGGPPAHGGNARRLRARGAMPRPASWRSACAAATLSPACRRWAAACRTTTHSP